MDKKKPYELGYLSLLTNMQRIREKQKRALKDLNKETEEQQKEIVRLREALAHYRTKEAHKFDD